jgi:hypothetical protein
MRLVEEWRDAWRWFSVQAMAAAAVVQAVWVGLPDDLKAHLPSWLVTALSLGLLAVGLYGRLLHQEKKQ